METMNNDTPDGVQSFQLIGELGNLVAEGQMNNLHRPDGSWDVNAASEELLATAQEDIEAGRVLGPGLVFALGPQRMEILALTWEPGNERSKDECYARVNRLLRALYWTNQLQASIHVAEIYVTTESPSGAAERPLEKPVPPPKQDALALIVREPDSARFIALPFERQAAGQVVWGERQERNEVASWVIDDWGAFKSDRLLKVESYGPLLAPVTSSHTH